MKTFWLFRSNIRELEYYHKYKDLESFEKNCHDYYLLLGIWLLRNKYFDQVIVWRLSDKKLPDIVFNVDGNQFIQRWVKHLPETFSYDSPTMSFFRGGFREYDEVTRNKPNHFGTKLYLGAGQRIFPRWNGIYDRFLIEDERDFNNNTLAIPFYKTASPHIFFPIKNKIINMYWDICWPCNFTQISYKGQDEFIKTVAQHPVLQKLKIVHCGNKPKEGEKLCKKYGVSNIEFLGPVERPMLNTILNSSYLGLNMSNRFDGCPRVSTEILMSGTPLVISEKTRILNYYKKQGVVVVSEKNIVEKIVHALENQMSFKVEVNDAIERKINFDVVNKKNIDLWKKIS